MLCRVYQRPDGGGRLRPVRHQLRAEHPADCNDFIARPYLHAVRRTDHGQADSGGAGDVPVARRGRPVCAANRRRPDGVPHHTGDFLLPADPDGGAVAGAAGAVAVR
uniref:(northern house mosquito) hypothetical protein n=1 Tax=Culex pipiens TaxID=7175 RepID=A0A8D8H8H3_CULPI